jgi:hypothetical protein
MGPVNETFSTAAAQLVPLAQELDQNKVTPGLLGFVIFAFIGAALWLLMKNMNKQFKKVDFEEAPDEQVGAVSSAATGQSGQGDGSGPNGRSGES